MKNIKSYLEDTIKNLELEQWTGLYTQLDLKEKEPLFPRLKEIQAEDRKEREIGIEEVFKASENLCIIGEPGAGKTTSLKWLFLKYAKNALTEKNSLIPVYVDLTRFTSAYEDFDGFIKGIIKDLPLLDKGFVFLIDGLDVLTEERVNLIEKFISSYHQNRFIASSRKEARLLFEKKLEILPLDEGKMKEYAKRYLKDKAGDFLNELDKSPQLKDLARNP
ncbi:MAG: NACHT domain-containing protein, partial [Candidatus Desantisbacteria bacterium]